MPARAAVARLTAGLLLAEFAVHEVRYATASAAGPHFHGAHLSALGAPVLGVLSAALLAHVLLRAAVAPQRMGPAGRTWMLWPLATLAVLALFISQEAAESALSHHHLGLGETLAGGWSALPAAAAAGALLALAARITNAVGRAPRPGRSLLARWSFPNATPVAVPTIALVARLASRAPDRLHSGRAPPSSSPS